MFTVYSLKGCQPCCHTCFRQITWSKVIWPWSRRQQACPTPSLVLTCSTSTGHVWHCLWLKPFSILTWAPMQACQQDSTKTSESQLWWVPTSPPCLHIKAWWPKASRDWVVSWPMPSQQHMAALNSEGWSCSYAPGHGTIEGHAAAWGEETDKRWALPEIWWMVK